MKIEKLTCINPSQYLYQYISGILEEPLPNGDRYFTGYYFYGGYNDPPEEFHRSALKHLKVQNGRVRITGSTTITFILPKEK